MIVRSHFLAAAALTLAGTLLGSPASAAQVIPDYIKTAVAAPGRPPEDVSRDVNVKPAEMIEFSGLKPGDKVVEMYPAYGYWIRIFSKVVGPSGHVYGITMMRDLGEPRRDRARQHQGEIDHLMVDGTLALENIKEYSNTTALWEAVSQYGANVALPELVDMIWCDHYHDMHDAHTGSLDMVALNKSIFQNLKPGGIYLIADNVGAPGTGIDGHVLHRSDPALLKEQVLAAGFVIDAESNMLRRDDDDYTRPTNKLGIRDTSDRILIRFKKPADAPNTDTRPKGADPLANYYGNTYIFNLGATGDTSGNRVRHVFYNKDGTYEEFGVPGKGPAPMQQGQWFWDVAGHNCMLHSYPIDERGFVVCQEPPMQMELNKVYEVKRGDNSVKVELVPGHVFPE